MQIQLAVGTARIRADESLEILWATIEELKATGFVHDALRRSGRNDATVAPPVSDPEQACPPGDGRGVTTAATVRPLTTRPNPPDGWKVRYGNLAGAPLFGNDTTHVSIEVKRGTARNPTVPKNCS
jgi:hypothetical protein